MSASQNDGPDDQESGSVAAEQSETRMRQALERLSGDKPPVHGERPSGAVRSQSGLQSSFSSAGPRRHRYVQDGEVPVVQISSTRERRRDVPPSPQALQEVPADSNRAALGQERSARQRAEQALERSQASIHALETRLGHAELTQREAAEQARTQQAANAQLRLELSEQAELLKSAQAQAAEAIRRQRELELELEEARSSLPDESLFAPEPPPLRVRRPQAADAASPVRPPDPHRTVRRGKPAQPALILAEADEPEPVKWWLTPPPKLKAKSRRAG